MENIFVGLIVVAVVVGFVMFWKSKKKETNDTNSPNTGVREVGTNPNGNTISPKEVDPNGEK